MSCQCKKNELHITATNNNNGAIKTSSVKALELVNATLLKKK